MSKKRKDSESKKVDTEIEAAKTDSKEDEREKRFLLIIVGDSTRCFSAPLECKSVALVKKETRRAFSAFRLKKCERAGLGFLACMIELRLSNEKSFKAEFNAEDHYSEGKLDDEPMIGDDEQHLHYRIDANKLIDDSEYDLWREESFYVLSLSNHGPLYDITVINNLIGAT